MSSLWAVAPHSCGPFWRGKLLKSPARRGGRVAARLTPAAPSKILRISVSARIDTAGFRHKRLQPCARVLKLSDISERSCPFADRRIGNAARAHRRFHSRGKPAYRPAVPNPLRGSRRDLCDSIPVPKAYGKTQKPAAHRSYGGWLAGS
jgi:hypothetical protein